MLARGPHQGEGHLGDGRIAIALDDMDLHAAFSFQRLGVHVGPRAGAQEDDVLQVWAALHDIDGKVGVVVDRDLHALQQGGQVVRGDVGVLMDVHGQVAGADQPPHDIG